MELLRDTWLIFGHQLRMTLRNPAFVIIGLFQPICQLLLFAPLLQALSNVPGFPPGGAYTVFTPGLLVMLGITGALFVGFGFLADVRAGVLERMRVTRISRLALVLGRSLCDLLMFFVQAVVLLVAAWPFGLRVDLLGLGATLVLLTLVSLTMSSVSYTLALKLKDENTFSSVLNFVMMPLLLLSGITLPLALAPAWLRTVAALNPFSYAVEGSRALFAGRFADTSVISSFGILIVLTVLGLLWAVRSFRQGMA